MHKIYKITFNQFTSVNYNFYELFYVNQYIVKIAYTHFIICQKLVKFKMKYRIAKTTPQSIITYSSKFEQQSLFY